MPERIRKWARRVYKRKDGYFLRDADYAAALILEYLEKEGGIPKEVVSQLDDKTIKDFCASLMKDGKPVDIGHLMAHSFVVELKNPSPPDPVEKRSRETFLEKGK